MSTVSLRELFSRLDKSSDKWASYLEVYEEFFAAFRNKPVSILEIGIQNGGFTSAIAEYFDQAERIVGCDIDERCSDLVFSDERISIVIGDASDVGTLERIKDKQGQFDIVIDDGSHTSKDIVAAFCHFFPLLREEGLFFAEDLHCSYWIQFEGGLANNYSSMSFFKLLADIINHEHWGVPQLRSRLVEKICAHHGCEISEEELSKIFSVTFINSLVVVKKKEPQKVLLGKRLIVGKVANVVDNYEYKNSAAISCDQKGNPYSDLDLISNKNFFGLQEQVLIELKEIKRELIELKENLSWVRRIHKRLKTFLNPRKL